MEQDLLRTITPDQLEEIRRRNDPVDRAALAAAREIVNDVRERGEAGLRFHAERFGDIEPGGPLYLAPDDLDAAATGIDRSDLALLERVAERIRCFARAQRATIGPMTFPISGGSAGQIISPMASAGCYAPGGRFPLPSSVLMTAVTARVAGVGKVWVASPRPASVTLAAAAIAGADGLLAAGGAQAIAALAYGAGPVPACDAVVGPGNRFVTAAKRIVAGRVGIDMLAGPSELAVLADRSADPTLIAADLLAQAEHDPDALPILITTAADKVADVNAQLRARLTDLPTAEIAREALGNGFAVVAADMDEAIALCDRIAPEHLELLVENTRAAASRCRNYGALFVGAGAAEVLGDYGAGPNHTLPTGGTARHRGGLSVFDFLNVRTWMRIDEPGGAGPLIADAERLADLEGLAGHARAARLRRDCEE